MNDLDLLVKKNHLMVRIMWGISILLTVFNIISGVDKKSLLFITPTLLIISMVCTILVVKKLVTEKIMYFISVGLCIIHFLFVFIFHDLNGFFVGFVILSIISLYQHFKSVLLTSFFVMATVTFGYFTGGEKMYGTFNDPLGLTIVIFIFIVTTVLICVQIKFTEKIRIDILKQREESESSRTRIETILNTLGTSISNLNNFSLNLESNINTTKQISNEITAAFNQISSNVESQVDIISSINNEIITENDDIINIVKESEHMQDLSKQNLISTKNIEENSLRLSDEMRKVHSSVSDTVSLMDNLKSEAENISSILETVNAISEQINMLALNAAIEAARAGEHGRGFAVVAEEVKRLAEQSKQSNSQISSILTDIGDKIQRASEQVNIIQEAAAMSSSSVDEMSGRSKEIYKNSSTIESKVQDISSITMKIQNTSSSILSSMGNISGFTEETSSSVEEVLASTKDQNSRIEDVVKSFESLEDLIIKLKNLIDNK